MKCFAYLSHATRPETDASLAELAHECASANAALDVTGVLAHANGRFAQLIEGPRDGVDHVIARINASRRHRDITVLGENAIDTRAFEGWHMLLCRREGIDDELERIARHTGLTPIQADLVARILLFVRWEGLSRASIGEP